MPLLERYKAVWNRLGVDDLRLGAFGQEVINAYNDGTRHYHNLDHLDDVLAKLDLAKDALEKSDEVTHLSARDKQIMFDMIELGLWYHDVVYDATAKDNEAQSCTMFLLHASKMEMGYRLQQDIGALIEATAHHKNARTLQERILTDCDLAILGANKETFEKYDKNIREEYSFVPAAAYKIGRRKVLAGFLDQERIFKTDAFHDLFEAQARENLITASTSPLQKILRKFT